MCGPSYTGYVATEGPLPKKGTKLVEKRGGGRIVEYLRESSRPKLFFRGTGTYPKSGKPYVEYEANYGYGTTVIRQREDTFRKSHTWGKAARVRR